MKRSEKSWSCFGRGLQSRRQCRHCGGRAFEGLCGEGELCGDVWRGDVWRGRGVLCCVAACPCVAWRRVFGRTFIVLYVWGGDVFSEGHL